MTLARDIKEQIGIIALREIQTTSYSKKEPTCQNERHWPGSGKTTMVT